MQITEPTIVLAGNDIDIGITARKNSNGFVAVDIGMGCDPEVFTPELVADERAGMPGWRFEKEYLRVWAAQLGQPVFEQAWMDRQKVHLKEPLLRMDLDDDGKLVKNSSGRVLVWMLPADQPEGVPDHIASVTRAFGMGIDVSEGVGASNSAIEIFAVDGREQAAEFASDSVTPVDLGRMAVAMARYWNNALICCVRPMHGITTLRTIVDEGKYGYVWFDKTKHQMSETQTNNLGWAKGEASSPALFNGWRDDFQYGYCILHSLACYQEHQQYIYNEFGHVTHQKLNHLPITVRSKHSDRAVASALARRACIDLPNFKKMIPVDQAPYRSYAWRTEQCEKRMLKKEQGWD